MELLVFNLILIEQRWLIDYVEDKYGQVVKHKSK